MGRLICILALLAFASSPVRADDERVTEAQRHFEAGMASFHLEEYDKAIDEWERGYRIKPAPQFLYNIAQAYRLSQRPEKALTFYQKYLRLDPKARNRAECERHITALTSTVVSPDRANPSPGPSRTPAGTSAVCPQIRTISPSTYINSWPPMAMRNSCGVGTALPMRGAHGSL
jgi:tetratricopeptide (TPR) repeat protein